MPDIQPEISILMPVFNMSGYLEECIISIQNQKSVGWELIAVDDFSVDNSLEKLRQLALQDKRIQVLQNSAKGIIPALALAFEHARGNYITRMDADDRMPENKLQLLWNTAKQNPKKVATGLVRYFSEIAISEGYIRYQEWLNRIASRSEFNVNIYRECIIASPNWMVHRSCFEKDISLAELNYPEDYDLVFQWYKRGYFFEAVHEVTHFWREHPQRTSRNSDMYQQQSFFRLKTNYFIDLELGDKNYVQLIGHGVKGKLVAAVLKQRKIDYDWFDYGKPTDNSILKSVEQLKHTHKTILTNWPVDPQIQEEILTFLASRKLIPGENVWLF